MRLKLCPGWCRGTFTCLCSCGMFTQMPQPPEQPRPPAVGLNPKLALPQKAGSHHPPMCRGMCLTVGEGKSGWRREGSFKLLPTSICLPNARNVVGQHSHLPYFQMKVKKVIKWRWGKGCVCMRHWLSPSLKTIETLHSVGKRFSDEDDIAGKC